MIYSNPYVLFTSRLPQRSVEIAQKLSKNIERPLNSIHYTQVLRRISEAIFVDFIERRHPDSNWGMEVLQTSALPLGYAATPQNFIINCDRHTLPHGLSLAMLGMNWGFPLLDCRIKAVEGVDISLSRGNNNVSIGTVS